MQVIPTKAFLVINHVGMSSWYDYLLYILQNMKIKFFVCVLSLYLYFFLLQNKIKNIDKPEAKSRSKVQAPNSS